VEKATLAFKRYVVAEIGHWFCARQLVLFHAAATSGVCVPCPEGDLGDVTTSTNHVGTFEFRPWE
jgi:hypothetical protein